MILTHTNEECSTARFSDVDVPCAFIPGLERTPTLPQLNSTSNRDKWELGFRLFSLRKWDSTKWEGELYAIVEL